jgi:hypothetical protein
MTGDFLGHAPGTGLELGKATPEAATRRARRAGVGEIPLSGPHLTVKRW